MCNRCRHGRPLLAPGRSWFWLADVALRIAIAYRDRRRNRA